MNSRTCIGCRKTDDATALVRLGIEASGRVQVDARRRMPGRGAWLHRGSSCLTCLEAAIRHQAFGKAFRRKAVVDSNALVSAMKTVERQERGQEA
jgi:predicted RNA-binding protein YlxR (DUF448 family)